MKRVISKIICIVLSVIMLEAYVPANVFGGNEEPVTADYSITPDYAARYPNGVIELYQSEVSVDEGREFTLKLIRMGGTEGKVSIELKAVDVSAKFGTDYTVRVNNTPLKQSSDYKGTLTETYLDELGGDYITADTLLTDEVYKQIIGYDENANALTEEESEQLREASVTLVSDILKVSEEDAERIVDQAGKATVAETDTYDPDAPYKSPLHELKDSVLGEKTAPNGMKDADMLGMEELIGNNDENLIASAVYDAAEGASLRVVFEDGQNEKTIVIKALEDTDFEPQEVFSLGLCNPEGGAEIGEILGCSVVINDNDETEPSTIGFASSLVTVGSDEICAAVDIVREGCLNDYAQIRVVTVSLNADTANDYLPIDTTSVFVPGEKQKTLIVPLKTSVADQTETKEIGVVLDVEAGSAEVDVSTSVIQILPMAAMRDNVKPVYNDDETVDYFTIDIAKVKDSGSIAGLFNELSGGSINIFGIKEITIGFTVLRNGNNGRWWDKYNEEKVFFGVFGHPNGFRGHVYDALPGFELKDGESGTFTLGIETPGSEQYATWSTDSLSFKFYKAVQRPTASEHIGVFKRGSKYMSRDDLKDFFNRYKHYVTVEELTWDDIQVNEIRLYPEKKSLFVSNLNGQKIMNVKAEYRVFNGTGAESIVKTEQYDGGFFEMPQWLYRGFDFSSIPYTITEEATARKAINVDYEIQGVKTVVKSRGSFLDIDSYTAVLCNDPKNLFPWRDISLIPMVRGALIGSVRVEDYEAERGSLYIGDKEYRNEKVTSDLWREGDELMIFAYPSHGYKCDKIEIVRADGKVEYIAPGGTVMLTKGMSVKPLFYEENITVTVSWKYPGSLVAYRNRAENMAGYTFTSTYNYTDNGDGTYTFKNMTPGDIVTMYLVPVNQDDTSAVLKASYLETLPAGEHRIALVTDKGEFKLKLRILPADSTEAVLFDTFKVNDPDGAVWKKGSEEGIRIVALSNSETVSSLKLDGSTVSTQNYTAFKGAVRTRTGYWTRNAVEGEVRLNDDVRFVPCIGDIYAFEVDDHDMEFTYYLVDKAAEEGGTLVRGKVVTKGGTIKRPSSVDITAENVDIAGIPVAGASVSVLSADPTDKITVNNVDYYTNATTDKDGYFTVYLPAYVENYGYCINISQKDRVYQGVSIFTQNGTTVYVLPHQNPNYQIDLMTIGSDLDTTEIYVTDSIVKLGIHAVIAPGYRAQKLVLRSYDAAGSLFKEWLAEESAASGWTYESSFVLSNNLKPGGRLTVELYDQYGNGLGEFETGYVLRMKPAKGSVIFPEYDPMDSVTLPVLGEMTTTFSFGSDHNVTPVSQSQAGSGNTSLGDPSDNHPLVWYMQVTYGSAGAVKKAAQMAKKTPGYATMTGSERAMRILGILNNMVAYESQSWYHKDTAEGEGTGGESSGEGSGTGEGTTPGGEGGGTAEGTTPGGEGNSTDPVTPPDTDPVTPPDTDPVTRPDTDPVTPPDIDPVTPPDTDPAEPPADDDPDWERILQGEIPEYTPNENDDGNQMENEPSLKAGDKKSDVVFTYTINAFLSFVIYGNDMYFDSITLYADAKVIATETRQYTLWGVPVYIKFNGMLEGSVIIHGDPKSGKPFKLTGYDSLFDGRITDSTEWGGVLSVKIYFEVGAGVGKVDFCTFGLSGKMTMEIEYQPWSDGAGLVTLALDAEMIFLKFTARMTVVKATFGMFRSKNYAGLMDFNNIVNADKFKNKKVLRSYRDANSETVFYGNLEENLRGSSLLSGNYSMKASDSSDPYNRVLAEKKIENVVKDVSPVLVPIGDGSKVLYLRLDDDATRGSDDYSSVAYSIIDWEGNETEPAYLENDGTFDFNLKAAAIGGGRVLAVWSDLDKSFGDADVENIGEMLNHADLSYCIFDENGVPGEIRKLTSGYGYEGTPSIAYDEQTGNVFVAYVSTDYQTEGITLSGDNIGEIGNFLYNSYSNVCFKVLDQNGDIVTDYKKSEASYQAYESANGKGALDGMRYLNTQANRKVTIATVREISAAAVDGKAYVVYSIDTDRTFSTDTDRELLLVTCDLETMEQSAPILLSEQETADTNPQLITYDGTVLMYWNQDGKLNCGDVVGYLNSTYNHAEYIENQAARGVNNMGEIANAASSYFVTVQPGGNLCIVWVDWEETEDGNVPAVFFREYDPAYGTYKDSEGVDHAYGMWGNITKIASVEKDQDISDVAYLGSGRKMLISYKVANKEEEGGIASYDSSLMLLKGGNREEIDFSLFPNEFPLAGEKTSLAVSVRNLASLPSSKLTVKADLIDKDGNITHVGTQVFEDHFESNEKVTALFEDLVYPEKPNNYVLRVTAWDDDLDDYPAVKYFRLPYSEKIGYSGADLIIRPDGSYEFYVDVSNDGNKAFDGHIAAGYTEMDGEGENARSVFRALSQVEELKLGIGETGKKTLSFKVPDEFYDEEGVCELEVAAFSNGEAARTETLYLYKAAASTAEPEDILLNAEDGKADLSAGETLALGGTISPYDARNGYRIVYSVDDPSVATVDALGNVTALKEGKATVTASVVKENTSLFIAESYRASSGGAPLSVDEFGVPTGLAETGAQEVLLSRTVEVTVTAAKYNVTEGSDSSWNGEENGGLRFVSDADLSRFVCVKIDGKVLDPSDYEISSESTEITLKSDFLKTLSNGEHVILIVSDDGNAFARFMIANVTNPPIPPTGDAGSLGAMLFMIVISASVLASAILVSKKRKTKKNEG